MLWNTRAAWRPVQSAPPAAPNPWEALVTREQPPPSPSPRPSLESQWLAAAIRLLTPMSGSRTLAEAAGDCVRALGESLGCDAGALWSVSGSAGTPVSLMTVWSAHPGGLAAYEARVRLRVLERGRDVAGRAWATGQPAVSAAAPPEESGKALKGLLAFPLLCGNAVVGIVELVRPEPFSLDAVTDQGALVVSRLLGEFVVRSQVSKDLARAERAMAALTEHSPLGISLIDRAGRILSVNEALSGLLGCAPEALVGKAWADFVEGDGAGVRDPWGQIEAGQPNASLFPLPARLRRADGVSHAVELLTSGVRDDCGNLDQVRVFVRDVTDLVQGRVELAATAGRYRRLLEGVYDYALHTLNPEGVITSWNKGAERLFGFEESEVLGRNCEVLFDPKSGQGTLARRMLQLAIDEGRFEFECLRRRKDRAAFWALVRFTCVRSDAGDVSEVSVLTHDETERRRLEGLRRRSADLDRLNRGVVEAARRSADMLRHVVERLDSPLRTLHAALADAQEREAGEVSPGSSAILEAGEQLAQAARALSSTGSGMVEALRSASSPVDLARVAAEALDLMREHAVERRLRLEIDVDPALSDVTMDAATLVQLTYNLLAHGVWASRERGLVTLRALAEGAVDFRFEVEDSGIGLTAAEAAALFQEPESTVDQAAQSLGLPAAKRIVEEHGGRVGIHSAPGRGSVVFAVLPRAPRERQARQERRGTPRTLGNVLVVSENLATRASLCWTLGRTSAEVIAAGGADEGLRIARERSCDAVAVDILLEEMPATDFVDRLRAEGLSRGATHLIAAIGAPGVGVAGIVAADLLPRPVPADRLFAALERARVSRGRAGRILVADSDADNCKSICRTLEVLDYAATPEVDAHGALKACAERPPAALLLSPFLEGMDIFSFLQHLRASGRTKDVPLLLLLPRTWTPEQLEALRTSAEVAARQGHWHRGLVLEGIDQGTTPGDLLGGGSEAPA